MKPVLRRAGAKSGWLVSLVAVLFVATGCASNPGVFSDFDSTNDFSGYNTFAWISSQPMTVVGDSGPSPLNAERLHSAIEGALKGKGFRQVDSPKDADFVVAYSVGGRDRMEVRTEEVQDFYGPHWRWGHEYYGFGQVYRPQIEVTSRQYTQGSLSIDIFDAQTKSPVWHGNARKKLSQGAAVNPNPESFQVAVDAILAGFPPGQSESAQ